MTSATDKTHWSAVRRTIYCSRAAIPDLVKSRWDEDVWLAWPGWTGTTPPDIPGCQVVAVQNDFAIDHDASVVFDDSWPLFRHVHIPLPGISVTVVRRISDLAWGVVPDADHYVVNYYSHTGAAPYTVARPPQPKTGAAVHLGAIPVPGSHGGMITVYAVVKSHLYPVGTQVLP
jgi:hypothetical protein